MNTARLLNDLEVSWSGSVVIRPRFEREDALEPSRGLRTARLAADPVVLWHPDEGPELTIPDWGRPHFSEPRVAWL